MHCAETLVFLKDYLVKDYLTCTQVCNEKFNQVHGMRPERQSEVVATIIGDKVEVKALCTAGQIEFDRTPPIVIIQTSIFMLIIMVYIIIVTCRS